MKTQLTRFTAIAALSVSAFATFVPFSNAAHAASAGDYAAWRSNYGTGTAAAGDSSGDGKVDGRDFLVWQRSVSPSADSDVDGRDFLVWQRGGSPAAFDPGFMGGVRVSAGDIK